MYRLWHRRDRVLINSFLAHVRFEGAGGGDGGNGGGAGGGGGGPSFVQTIPESYRDKEWAKQNAKDPDTFFKWVDNLNTSFGKKGPAVPGEGATPEEVTAYRKFHGVPDKPEGYEFANIEELKDAKRDAEVEGAIKKLMHEAGISKAAATKLQQGYEKLLFQRHQKDVATQKTLDEAFDKSAKEIFGDKKDAVLANAKKMLAENVPPAVAARLEKLDNDSLLILTAALDGIVKKYVKEDGFQGGGDNGAGSGGETFESLSQEQRKLFASEAFRNSQHADHQKAHAQNKAIMEKMRALSAKK